MERQIQHIMESDGDRCSLCKVDFAHNNKTFGGATAGGVAALVGECCQGKVREVLVAGAYTLGGNYGHVGAQQTELPSVPFDAVSAAHGLHDRIGKVDGEGREIARRAGVTKDVRIDTSDSVWKATDAAWFAANPQRSHRMRPLFAGEEAAMFADAVTPALPAGHAHEVLVRQVEPGRRIKKTFGRNLDAPIPDVEAIIHALLTWWARARSSARRRLPLWRSNT